MTQIIQDIIAKNKTANSSKAAYQFPNNLGDKYMLLTFYDFKDRSTILGTVALPPPISLSDSTNIEIQSTDLGLMAKLAIDVIKSAENDGLLETMYKSGSNLWDVGEKTAGEFGAALNKMGITNFKSKAEAAGGDEIFKSAAYFARNMITKVGDFVGVNAGTVIDVTTGTYINPHKTLVFEGTNLKTHQFSWVLSPSDQDESSQINDIIKTLKINSLPKYEPVTGVMRALLAYPSSVGISFGPGIDKDYFYNNIIKKGMISNVTVDYFSQGPAFVKGGKPAMVSLSFSMTEEEIHTRDDYEG